MDLPKTGENDHILLIVYIIITITAFIFAVDLETENRRRT
jgi:LPXTG-motif cell wall-anchored protein